jgi:transposase
MWGMTATAEPASHELQKQLEQMRNVVAGLTKEIEWFKERVAWFERQMFGKKSERVVQPAQADQFFPGMGPPKEKSGEMEDVAAHKRKKKTRKPENDYANGLVIPEDLPVEQTVLDLPEEKKVCPETGVAMVRIGEEVTRQLAHRPGQYFVKETIRPKYAIPSREEAGVFVCETPSSILPRSRADESLLAEIVTMKFADHLPLHRISEIFSRDNVQITRQLLSQWVIRLGFVLMPLYDLMLKRVKDSGVVFVDESPVRLQVKGKGRLQQGYMWVLAGGGGSDPPYRVYRYCENRNHSHAYQLLEDFSGIMHTDKYGAYEQLSKRVEILWQPCWAHIRRKFEEAESGDLEFRKMILRKIRYLFMLERVAWARSEEERLKIRKEKEAPIIDELIAAVNQKIAAGGTLFRSKFGMALNYFHGLIPHLKNYLSHPSARMDNNVAERALRCLAIGRKNWLFVGSMSGGQATAVLLTLVQTCRALGINPREYLEDVFRRFLDHPMNRLNELLPDEWAALRQSAGQKPVPTKPLHVR